ncbi:MAG TPA: HrpE/YscL family type III secretion apparatus protein [Limnobacter sp.]|nr:HrpE/YscL family type III secretion apparatus protein [Limnobacter sp.]
MLKTLRRVAFPAELQTSGPVIKAALLNHVSDHQSLMAHADHTAKQIIEQAQTEAAQIRDRVQHDVAQSMHKDLTSLKQLTQQKEAALRQRSSALCTQVCMAVFEQAIQDLPEQKKIQSLVDMLLSTHHHSRMLNIRCHPSQETLVHAEVAQWMAQQMNLRQWSIQTREELQPYEIVISTTNGGEIQVSLDNLLALYNNELEALHNELAPLIDLHEETHENMD